MEDPDVYLLCDPCPYKQNSTNVTTQQPKKEKKKLSLESCQEMKLLLAQFLS